MGSFSEFQNRYTRDQHIAIALASQALNRSELASNVGAHQNALNEAELANQFRKGAPADHVIHPVVLKTLYYKYNDLNQGEDAAHSLTLYCKWMNLYRTESFAARYDSISRICELTSPERLTNYIALNIAKGMLEHAPENEWKLTQLSILAFRFGSIGDAQSGIELIKKFTPDSWQIYEKEGVNGLIPHIKGSQALSLLYLGTLSRLYELTNEWARADQLITLSNRYLELPPDQNIEMQLERVNCQIELNNPMKAVSILDSIDQSSKDEYVRARSSLYYSKIGMLFMYNQEIGLANECLEVSLEMADSIIHNKKYKVGSLHANAQLLMELERGDDARELYIEALSIEGVDQAARIDLLENYAELNLNMDETEVAKQAYQDVLAYYQEARDTLKVIKTEISLAAIAHDYGSEYEYSDHEIELLKSRVIHNAAKLDLVTISQFSRVLEKRYEHNGLNEADRLLSIAFAADRSKDNPTSVCLALFNRAAISQLLSERDEDRHMLVRAAAFMRSAVSIVDEFPRCLSKEGIITLLEREYAICDQLDDRVRTSELINRLEKLK